MAVAKAMAGGHIRGVSNPNWMERVTREIIYIAILG
jgi:hypothetical protein